MKKELCRSRVDSIDGIDETAMHAGLLTGND